MSAVLAGEGAAAPLTQDRPTILCIDDEPNVLSALGLHLRRRYNVLTATSGAAALQLMQGGAQVAVIMSDMRMPVMDGAALLQAARKLAPTTTRMLLTGQSDLASAIAAVNQGGIFRFLTKPCPPAELLSAVAEAVQQHALVTAERVLLEQTLHGSIKTLINVLALTHPAAFGRAVRAKQLVAELAQQMDLADRWQLEVAAMLLPLGMVALSAETAEKVYYGQDLDETERKAVARCPEVSEQLLGNIPRLELVRETIARYWKPNGAGSYGLTPDQSELAGRNASILRTVVDFDILEAQGMSPADRLATLRGRSGRYDVDVLAALDALRGAGSAKREIREIPAHALRAGMVIAADIRLASGVLLVARGFEVTTGLVERIRNLKHGALAGPVRVYV